MTGQRKALIVACGEYEHDGLRRLPASAADADALQRVLGDARIGGFDVQVVRDQPAYVVKVQIEDLLAEARPDDVVLLHFSGHGLKNEAGELFFAAHDTKPNRLASTAVSADFVERGMRSSRSRRIVLLLNAATAAPSAAACAPGRRQRQRPRQLPRRRAGRGPRPGGHHRIQRDGIRL
jgi:uncharacterized caspase-like protein